MQAHFSAVVLLHVLWKHDTFYFQDFWLVERSKEQHLFWSRNLLNIIFTVAFNQFNKSLMNKSIYLFVF